MKVKIQISGITSLLMNRFDINESEQKIKDKNLTPREKAQKVCYLDEKGKLYYPTNNILACIIEAGKFHKAGKSKITTARSSLIPAYVMIHEERIPFTQPQEWNIDTRAVVVPSTGGRIVCHRPRIDDWKLDFMLSLDTKGFSANLLRTIIEDAGGKVGLGDFRPQRKGVFGRFEITKWGEI